MLNYNKKQGSFLKVSVVGLGYIGLPTAAILASRKIQVHGVDISQTVVDTINRGEIHIIEPELDMLVHSTVTEGFLTANIKPTFSDAFIIAVPTPVQLNHQPDLSYIEASCSSIAPFLQEGNLVILESTSPVGTAEKVAEWLAAARPDLTFPQTDGENSQIRIAYCPERVLPGHVLRELVSNDRIIGGLTEKCSERAAELYQIFVEGECIITDSRTAEMCKLTENTFRDVNLAFANELSVICDKFQINVWNLIQLANRHPRVNILQPGPGVGGHCIAVDPWFIVSQSPDEAKLIRSAREVNDAKPEWVINKIDNAVKIFLQNYPDRMSKHITISCFGLSFKADIDDLRESPSLCIVRNIVEKYPGRFLVIEPNINVLPRDLQDKAELCSIEEGLAEADIIVLLVDHKEFKKIERAELNGRQLVDTRGIWL